MRLGTRIFLAIAAFTVALLAVEVALQLRQLRAIERGLERVATTVGRAVLELDGVPVAPPRLHGQEMVWVQKGPGGTEEETHVVMVPAAGGPVIVPPAPAAPGAGSAPGAERRAVGEAGERLREELEQLRVELEVVRERRGRALVIKGIPGGEEEIPLPVEGTLALVRRSVRTGLAVGTLLLLAGLAGAVGLAGTVARPLAALARGAERLGAGESGVQVPVSGPPEVVAVQTAFNDMSRRLVALERERERWRERERLAELGELARGLAHTLRNPLNTLGLVVEELARDGGTDRGELVGAARGEIQRVDRWLRSFLAVAAGDGGEVVRVDLGDLLRDAVLEASGRGPAVRAEIPERTVPVEVIPQAVRAALANLLDNAVEAAGEDGTVQVDLMVREGWAVVRIDDDGPGLPREVQERLFAPHVTTRPGGSGMGLFLAQRLVEGLHEGRIRIGNRPEGGTAVEVRLPLAGPRGARRRGEGGGS